MYMFERHPLVKYDEYEQHLFTRSSELTLVKLSHFTDDVLIKKLCFREILLISNIDKPVPSESDKIKPAGLGGLCLKVELAQGMPPSEPLRSEDDIDKNIAERIKQIKLGKCFFFSCLATTPTETLMYS